MNSSQPIMEVSFLLNINDQNYMLCYDILMGNHQKKYINIIKLLMLSKAIVGGGCFWCVEAVLQRVKGIQKIESGYAGGLTKNPTYNDICTGKTGHAEICRIYFDPKVIDYKSK